MANEQTPSDMVAARVREVRGTRRLTVAELADRCAALGVPHLTAQALYKLEGQRKREDRKPRPVTVDELLTLALALRVFPVHLLVPPDDAEAPYPVTGTLTEPRYRVRHWVRGLKTLGRFPKGGEVRDLWSQVPADEFEAMQAGQCPVCGGRRTEWVETAPGRWVKEDVGPDGEHRETT